MKFGFNGPSGLIVLNLGDSDQGQSMTLTFGTQSFMYSFSNIESERFWPRSSNDLDLWYSKLHVLI